MSTFRRITLCAMLSAAFAVQAGEPPRPEYGPDITIEAAKKIAAGVIAECAANKWNVAVAVVNTHGSLVYYERMNNTQSASAQIAVDKAKVGAMYRRPTRAFVDAIAKAGPAVMTLPGVVASPGGVPIMSGGKVIGGVGVSGVTGDQDEQCAKAGLGGPVRTLFAAAVLAAAAPCTAQTAWKPDKPVEFVVLSSPGGGNDRTARLIQKIWREAKWLDTVNVLNKPGGGGAIAYTYVSQHPGDAHYIAVVRKGVLTNHILGRSTLHYSELTPLAVVANEPNAVAVRADSPMKSARDLAERLKTDPLSITTSVGSTRGGPSHMLVVQLAKMGGADPRKLKIVTFSGSAESVTNLLGGHIEVISSSVDALVPHHKAGTMRILGVATAARSPALPNVPTFRDQGYDILMGNWTAIMGPKGLTPAQVAYWEDLLERTFNHPAWKSMLEADALEADFRRSQPTRELLAKDYELERRMLTELGMVR